MYVNNNSLWIAIIFALLLHSVLVLFISSFLQINSPVSTERLAVHINKMKSYKTDSTIVPQSSDLGYTTANSNVVPVEKSKEHKSIVVRKEVLSSLRLINPPQKKKMSDSIRKTSEDDTEQKTQNTRLNKVKANLEIRKYEKKNSSILLNSKVDYSILMNRIYKAISQNRLYPYRARKRLQQGTVYVSFQLSSDGIIDDVKIIQSSGFSLLDKSAMNTVAAISPVEIAHHFIHKTETINVHINYRLTENYGQ